METTNKTAIKYWLLCMLALVAGIVCVGGITRLTGSGLSMVQWQPIAGLLPPITAMQWAEVFMLYQATPEYQQLNTGITLSQFKGIFFWEYLHRIFGRVIGLAAMIPFCMFWYRGRLNIRFKKVWLFIILLIGCQGLLGWYMVKSGLVNVPHVSHFRLAAHLCLAFLIFILIFWQYLGYVATKSTQPVKALRIGCHGISLALALQIVYGAFTAGLQAGHFYNTYPKMGPDWIPDAIFLYPGFFNNLLNNPIMVQFMHRWLGAAVLLGCFYLVYLTKKSPCFVLQRGGLLLLGAVSFQFILGVATLLTGVWLPLAAAHQLGALVLLSSIVYLMYINKH
jgi:heme a synthase